uniref:Uncharacterized protein n=1 Tax=Tetranychus urticae TaxID=32264 RepID=T1L4M7_TETUR
MKWIQTSCPWLYRGLVFIRGAIWEFIRVMITNCINDYIEAYRKDGVKGVAKAVGESIREIFGKLFGSARNAVVYAGRLFTRKEITEMFTEPTNLTECVNYAMNIIPFHLE